MRDDAFAAMDQPELGRDEHVRRRAGRGLVRPEGRAVGLGADELFDGYGHVERVEQLERALRLPRPSQRRQPPAHAPAARWREAPGVAAQRGAPGRSYEFIRRVLVDADVRGMLHPGRLRLNDGPAPWTRPPVAAQIMERELRHFLGDMLLRNTDAMSMAHSLELRVPFLDDALVAWGGAPSEGPAHARAQGAARGGHRRSGPRRDPLAAQARVVILPYAPWLRGPLAAEAEEEFAHVPAELAEVVKPEAMQAIWRDYAATGSRWVRAWSLYSLIKWTRGLDARSQA